MKKMSMVVAAVFSLLSFSAFAGENCIYGQDQKLAISVEDNQQKHLMAEKVDPTLLAMLKKHQLELERSAITYN